MNDHASRRAFLRVLTAASAAVPAWPESNGSHSDHVAWVAASLERMLTIKPGMSRSQLMTVFTTEGGLSTPLQRTFVSRDCPLFKADVTFHRATNDPSGGRESSLWEADDDVISTISQPYLQFSIYD